MTTTVIRPYQRRRRTPGDLCGIRANYLEPSAPLRLCLKTPRQVILVVTFGTIARADVMAQGLVEAIKVHQPKQPIVTCIRGTNEESLCRPATPDWNPDQH